MVVGMMTGPEAVEWCAAAIAGLDIARHDLVAGHQTPDDQPEAVAAIASWLDEHDLR
jgi:haloalkane dehalogenase